MVTTVEKKEIVPTAVAAEMAASLTGESIERSYNTMSAREPSNHRMDNTFLFLGLLNSMCQDYIRQMGLVESDQGYKNIVDNLTALTGLTNQDHRLNTGEVNYCIKNGLIPINIDAMYVEVEPAMKIQVIRKQHFDNIIELASILMGSLHYEMQDAPDSARQSSYENFTELVKLARNECALMYSFRMQERKDSINNMNIQQKGDALDFDL